MMNATVNIGGQEIKLVASAWTWIEYKRIFKRDWNADRDKNLAAARKAILFSLEYSNLTDEQFAKLPKEKQDAYWRGINENSLSMDFALDTIYAMAVSGGYNGTQKDLLINLSPTELSDDSELMKAFTELSKEFVIELKKNITAAAQ